MKQILLLVVGVWGVVGLCAQTNLTIEPALVKKQVMADLSDLNYEEVIKVMVSNPSSQTMRLQWDKVVEYQPYNWESQICDKVASYPPEVVTNYDPLQGMQAPIELGPGESFELYLTILPYSTTGQTKIEIPFRSIDDPETIIGKAVFQVNLIDDREQGSRNRGTTQARLYPNPVIDRFFVAGAPDLSRLEVFNTLGSRVKVFNNPQPGDSFFVADIPQGVYLVTLIDENGKVVRTIRMLRRDFRP